MSESQIALGENGKSSNRIRVAVADDHAIFRECLAESLRARTGFDVVGEAETGLGALRLVRKFRPDVLVMDVDMPDMDGIAATREITRDFPATRVIGLSLHEETSCRKAMVDAGAVAYIPKFRGLRVLVDAIRQAHHSSGAPSTTVPDVS